VTAAGLAFLLVLNTCPAAGAANACDLNNDGKVDAADVQTAIDMALGLAACTANILGPGVCNVIVVERVIGAAMGKTCNTTGLPLPHSATLSWVASISPNVAGYNIYRSNVAGGPYQLLTRSLVTATSYEDKSVQAGLVYYYAVNAVDTDGNSSDYSNEVRAVIPAP